MARPSEAYYDDRSLRAMTTELYPPDVNRLGLGALARLGDPLEERGISLELELPPKCELDRDHAALFYRVAREALANTAKHSKARFGAENDAVLRGVPQPVP